MEDPEGTQHIDDVDIESSRSSERTHSTIPVGVNASFSNTDFYRPSLRRQNRFFGGGVVIIAAAFVAAYFLMDMSFTPSNVRTFGDESHFEGGSGEVGADASNAEMQAIIDEEITELEEEGNFGEAAKTKGKGAKGSKKKYKLKNMVDKNEKVGENEWVEDKKWWEKNEQNIEEAEKEETPREKRTRQKFENKCKMQEKRGKYISEECKEFLLTNVDSIEEKHAVGGKAGKSPKVPNGGDDKNKKVGDKDNNVDRGKKSNNKNDTDAKATNNKKSKGNKDKREEKKGD